MDGALKQLTQANERTWGAMGGVSRAMENEGQATECYERALAHNPYSPSALAGLGGVYKARGDYRKVSFTDNQLKECTPVDSLLAATGLRIHSVAVLHNGGTAAVHVLLFKNSYSVLFSGTCGSYFSRAWLYYCISKLSFLLFLPVFHFMAFLFHVDLLRLDRPGHKAVGQKSSVAKKSFRTSASSSQHFGVVCNLVAFIFQARLVFFSRPSLQLTCGRPNDAIQS